MGGRPRKPTKLLLLGGAQKRNPARMRGRATKKADGTWSEDVAPAEGLGDAPKYFESDDAMKACWAELIEVVPAGVLTRMDRPAAALLCKLWAESKRNKTSVSQDRLLASLFGKFGLTPSERSKVSGGQTDGKKKGNRFLGLA